MAFVDEGLSASTPAKPRERPVRREKTNRSRSGPKSLADFGRCAGRLNRENELYQDDAAGQASVAEAVSARYALKKASARHRNVEGASECESSVVTPLKVSLRTRVSSFA